jgi:hypothetical protein
MYILFHSGAVCPKFAYVIVYRGVFDGDVFRVFLSTPRIFAVLPKNTVLLVIKSLRVPSFSVLKEAIGPQAFITKPAHAIPFWSIWMMVITRTGIS